MLTRFLSFVRDEAGATMIEYGLVIALVGLAAAVVLTSIGTSISDIFTTVGDKIAGADTN